VAFQPAKKNQQISSSTFIPIMKKELKLAKSNLIAIVMPFFWKNYQLVNMLCHS